MGHLLLYLLFEYVNVRDVTFELNIGLLTDTGFLIKHAAWILADGRVYVILIGSCFTIYHSDWMVFHSQPIKSLNSKSSARDPSVVVIRDMLNDSSWRDFLLYARCLDSYCFHV